MRRKKNPTENPTTKKKKPPKKPTKKNPVLHSENILKSKNTPVQAFLFMFDSATEQKLLYCTSLREITLLTKNQHDTNCQSLTETQQELQQYRLGQVWQQQTQCLARDTKSIP